jgi:hypothetical protein
MERKPVYGKRKRQSVDQKKIEMFYSHDGWNVDYLEEIGLMQILADFAKFRYELDSCVRGSSFISGNTPKALLETLDELKEELEDIYHGIRHEIGG